MLLSSYQYAFFWPNTILGKMFGYDTHKYTPWGYAMQLLFCAIIAMIDYSLTLKGKVRMKSRIRDAAYTTLLYNS